MTHLGTNGWIMYAREANSGKYDMMMKTAAKNKHILGPDQKFSPVTK